MRSPAFSKHVAQHHRLHYRWSQLEAERARNYLGSPSRPRPKADRVMRLPRDLKVSKRRLRSKSSLTSSLWGRARAAWATRMYRTVNYSTFTKNGVLKLTEVELYFLSLHITKSSCSKWAVVYLGVGNGERFRYLRDEFFPNLAVLAFNPIDEFLQYSEQTMKRNAESWNNDGSGFTFELRCFDPDSDINWILEKLAGKRLLLISDIRGVYMRKDGNFDMALDQEVQLKAIQRLRPEHSLVKFTFPTWPSPKLSDNIFEYAPGVILKQVFSFYETGEVRLMIKGVPQQLVQYNGKTLLAAIDFHQFHRRGQVYKARRKLDHSRFKCVDNCFDCTVLWNTVSKYAEINSENPHDVFEKVLRDQVYTHSSYVWSSRRADVKFFLNNGRLMEAVAALEDKTPSDDDIDWRDLASELSEQQPQLAERMRADLPQPASRGDMITLLASLSSPFTEVRSHLNTLLQYAPWWEEAK